MSSLRDHLDMLRAQLLDLLRHPEATSQDKASVVRAGTALSEIGRRHGMRLPSGDGFEPIPGLDPGWMLRRERAEEASADA